MFSTLISISVALGLAPLASALAFPGAVGFGAVSTGGTGGTTCHVTNLNDSGSGSFRDCVSASNRIVVFDVAGYIKLSSAVSLSSHLTIDGSTAPSPGIGIMAGEVSGSGKNNIIITNVRFRQGSLDPQTGKSAVNFGTASNIILDHCSFAYGQWDSKCDRKAALAPPNSPNMALHKAFADLKCPKLSMASG